MRFSANLGFLWKDLPLPDAIHRASAAGFDAVECHAPYDHEPREVLAALEETGLQLVSLNTRFGRLGSDFGVTAVPGREAEARAYLDEAVAFAASVGCAKVNVVAGSTGQTAEAEATYRSNLTYGAEQASLHGVDLLLEPINATVAPGYHLTHIAKALDTIEAIEAPNIHVLLDCFHTTITEGDVLAVVAKHVSQVGHVQIASLPGRGEPNTGDVDYLALLPALIGLGYSGYFGAEYTPRTTIDAGLSWLDEFRQAQTGGSIRPNERDTP